MDTIIFQRATLDDVGTYRRLEQTASGLKTYSVFLDDEKIKNEIATNTVYFIKKNNECVGMVEYRKKNTTPPTVYIGGLVIVPEFQGQGIARTAMDMILNELKDVQRFELVVHPENTAALALYQSLGFIVESKKDNYFGDGEPRLVMTMVRS